MTAVKKRRTGKRRLKIMSRKDFGAKPLMYPQLVAIVGISNYA
jgi:hypothetical protein